MTIDFFRHSILNEGLQILKDWIFNVLRDFPFLPDVLRDFSFFSLLEEPIKRLPMERFEVRRVICRHFSNTI